MRVKLLVVWCVCMVWWTGTMSAASLSEQVCAGGQCQSAVYSLGNGHPVSQLLQFGQSGAAFNLFGQAWAQDYATLKAYASSTATNDPKQDIVFGAANAVDRLFFPGLSSGSVDFVFGIEGQTSFALAAGRAELDFSYGPNTNIQTNQILWRQATAGTGITNVPLQTSFTVTMTFGAFVDFNFTLTSLIQCSSGGFAPTCNGSATTDFLDTMALTQLIVRDSNGNVVTSPTITSESGFDYTHLPGLTSTAPEPGTAVTVTVVIFALCLRRRRSGAAA
jgi:hypothetical protein